MIYIFRDRLRPVICALFYLPLMAISQTTAARKADIYNGRFVAPKQLVIKLDEKAALTDSKESISAPPQTYQYTEGEVASISSSQIKLKFSDDEKVKTYFITSKTKIYEASSDRRLTWKAIKKGDYVAVHTKVNSKVALSIVKNS